MALTRKTWRGRRALVALAVLAALGLGAVLALRAVPTSFVITERCVATAGGTTHDLAPDQAANAATIAAIAVQRGLPARAATIAIATAIQESKLRNLDYGDRDSLGLFQQRPSQGWGTAEQVMNPVYATNTFYDVLVQIERYEALEITDASDRVQRSAYPEAVADHEPAGRAFASALTGYSPAALTCRLGPAEDAGEPAAVAAAIAAELGGLPVTTEGGRVIVDVGGRAESGRIAWAVAHWAVAHAARHDVVRVAVDDRQWRRDAPDDGWTAIDDGTPAPGAASVVIELASADAA